jgi:hypothetical protein
LYLEIINAPAKNPRMRPECCTDAYIARAGLVIKIRTSDQIRSGLDFLPLMNRAKTAIPIVLITCQITGPTEGEKSPAKAVNG